METIRIFEHGNMDTRRMARPFPLPGPKLRVKAMMYGIWNGTRYSDTERWNGSAIRTTRNAKTRNACENFTAKQMLEHGTRFLKTRSGTERNRKHIDTL